MKRWLLFLGVDEPRRRSENRDVGGGGGVWVASRCWSAFGHQITSAAPITGLRPDIKSAWPSPTSYTGLSSPHLEPLTRDQAIAHTTTLRIRSCGSWRA